MIAKSVRLLGPIDLGAAALQEQVPSDDMRQRTPERVTFAGLVFDLDARTLTDAGGNDLALTPRNLACWRRFCAARGGRCRAITCFSRWPAARPRRSIAVLTCWSDGCGGRSRLIRRTRGDRDGARCWLQVHRTCRLRPR